MDQRRGRASSASHERRRVRRQVGDEVAGGGAARAGRTRPSPAGAVRPTAIARGPGRSRCAERTSADQGEPLGERRPRARSAAGAAAPRPRRRHGAPPAAARTVEARRRALDRESVASQSNRTRPSGPASGSPTVVAVERRPRGTGRGSARAGPGRAAANQASRRTGPSAVARRDPVGRRASRA